jgi:hypothetical protein
MLLINNNSSYLAVLLVLITIHYCLVIDAHYILDDSKCRKSKYPVLRNTLKYDFFINEKTDIDPTTGLVRDQIQCVKETRKRTTIRLPMEDIDDYVCNNIKFIWPEKATCEADYLLDSLSKTYTNNNSSTSTDDNDDRDDFETFAFVFSHWHCYSYDNPITSGIQMICPYRRNTTLCDVHMSSCFVRFSSHESSTTFIAGAAIGTILGLIGIGIILMIGYCSYTDNKIKLS